MLRVSRHSRLLNGGVPTLRSGCAHLNQFLTPVRSLANQPPPPPPSPNARVKSSSSSPSSSSSSSSPDLSTFRPRTAKIGSLKLREDSTKSPNSSNTATTPTDTNTTNTNTNRSAPNDIGSILDYAAAPPSQSFTPSSSASSGSRVRRSRVEKPFFAPPHGAPLVTPTKSKSNTATTTQSTAPTTSPQTQTPAKAAPTVAAAAPQTQPSQTSTITSPIPPPTNPLPSSSSPSSGSTPPPPPPPPPPPSSSSSSSSPSSSPTPAKGSVAGRVFRWGLVFVIGSGIALVVIEICENIRINDEKVTPATFLKRGAIFSNSMLRLWRDLYCALRILADYEWSLWRLEGDELEAKKKIVHLRSALRLRDLMSKNGGVYIKFGQHVAQLQFLLPDEYVDTMKPMLNQAPTSSMADVRRVYREEFGKELEEVFEQFDQVPIASASLAQVYFARLKPVGDETVGREVAVKVQHAALQANCESDIATVNFIIKLIHRLDARFNYQWLADEMATNLPLECDFVHEARNSERARKNFECDRGREDIAVPRILWAHTSKRVLTMERMFGCLVNDVDGLRKAGISREAVSSLMSQVFSEMIFLHGFVHCDPHAGNMLVSRRSATDSRPRLILLDHGLYRELSDEFRIAYAYLWNSLIRGDGEGIKKYSQLMNAGEMYPLFASMLTRKAYHKITAKKGDMNSLVLKNDESERRELQAGAVEYAQDVQRILAQIPKELLLLLKTNDCLRAIDMQLGTPINSFIIMARYCTKAINQDRLKRSATFTDWLRAAIDTASMEIRLKVYQFLLMLARWWSKVEMDSDRHL